MEYWLTDDLRSRLLEGVYRHGIGHEVARWIATLIQTVPEMSLEEVVALQEQTTMQCMFPLVLLQSFRDAQGVGG